jgi:DNA polymerase Pol2
MIRSNPDNAILNARSETLKVLANSYYGYMGFYGSRWYSFEAAQAVTAYGRYHIKNVISKALERGYDVIYSDTDSIFLANTDENIKGFAKEVNLELPGIMELEFEGTYPKGIFVPAKQGETGAKKKYALLKPDGKIYIKGFETVRRNWSYVAKEAQEKVLQMVLSMNDPAEARDYILGLMDDIRDRKIPNNKFVIRTQLVKDIKDYDSIGPHVMAAKRMQESGRTVTPGIVVSYIISEGTGKISDRVRLPEELEQGGYDPDYYIKNQLIPSVDRIFDVLDLSIRPEDRNQSKLDGFFK